MEMINQILDKNGLIFAFVFVGLIMAFSFGMNHLFKNKIPAVALAVFIGLAVAVLGGEKGIANIPFFSGVALLGSSMLRDFAIVSTAMGAEIDKIKQAGKAGIIALFVGITYSFTLGSIIALALGFKDPKIIATLAAGGCTYIVGPVTGTALGVGSDILALSIAIGLVKVIITTIMTPLIAKKIGLNNPKTAMVYGGIMGTTSGVSAGLAATDEKLVPYGAFTSTFFTGLACLLCPSVFYFALEFYMRHFG